MKAAHFPSLTDEELLSWFRVTRNDLTTTALEVELAKRLAAAIDGAEDTEDLEKQIEEMTVTNSDLSDQVRALEDKIQDIKNIINS